MNPTSGGATKTTKVKSKGSARAALRDTLSKMMKLKVKYPKSSGKALD